jgi:NADPH:quinone reductase-like Zn-dependent oxidoreductase
MQAITYTRYGSPDVLKLSNLEIPEPRNDEILIKMKATAVNSADIRLRKADPFLVRLMFGLLKPKNPILGTVVSGVVEKAGKDVTKFKIGDRVFGLSESKMSTYAEYVCLPQSEPLALKPDNLSFQEAASIPFGSHTALYFLKKAKASLGKKILIYGASGAVGSSAIGLAKHFGMEVTAVCSKGNIDLVKSLGADHVIDYTKNDLDDFHNNFDIVFETVNKAKITKIAKLVKKSGTLILGAAIFKNLLIGMFLSQKNKFKLIAGEAKVTSQDMRELKELCQLGKLKPVIDKVYSLEDIQKAHSYADLGHKKGNLIISFNG